MFWEIIFIQLHRSTADLPHDEILPPVIVKVQGHHAPAVTIGIGAGHKAHFHKILASNIEVGAVALITAQVVAHGNVKGVARPEFIQTLVQFRRSRHFAGAIERL